LPARHRADWLLQQAGGHNLATHTGYKPFSVESLAGLDPEVLVFADRALSGEAAKAALFKENPILNSSRAAKPDGCWSWIRRCWSAGSGRVAGGVEGFV
jgi:ABC-type hemin transport system substrate-binding protein